MWLAFLVGVLALVEVADGARWFVFPVLPMLVCYSLPLLNRSADMPEGHSSASIPSSAVDFLHHGHKVDRKTCRIVPCGTCC